MAGYDAQIRISTKIDTSQMQQLNVRIDKAVEKAARLNAVAEELKNKKLPTEGYAKLEGSIDNAKNALESLEREQKRLAAAGFGKDSDKEILKAYHAVHALKAELEATISTKNHDAYLGVEDRLNRAKSVMQDLMSKDLRHLPDIVYNASVEKDINKTKTSIAATETEMQKLVDTGKAFTMASAPDEIAKAAKEAGIADRELRALLTKKNELMSKQNKVKANQDKLSESLKRFAQVGKKAFSGVNDKIKKTGGLLSTFASRLKGIALSLLIFNWITKGFNAMVAGMKEGFHNLVQYSDSYNKSMSLLKSANTQLKNSFATAFAPIVTLIIPHLITLINYITLAANKVAQFMAVLTGKSTWIKAKSVQEDYASSLEGTAAAAKKAAGALASFDTLEVLNKQSTSGGGGLKPGDMFEEIPIEQGTSDAVKNLKEWLEKLKEAAEPTMQAFRQLWDEGFSKLQEFTCDTLIDFYHNFLVPVGSWMLGEGLPRLFNITNDMLNEIDWDRLRGALAGLYSALSDLTVFVFDGLLDFYEYFLKPLSVWFFSSALPQLLDILVAFVEEVDWDKLKQSLKNFWVAIEPFAEQFGQGLIDFFQELKNIGVTFLNGVAYAIDDLASALSGGKPENARGWAAALCDVAVAVTALKLAFAGFGLISRGWGVLKEVITFFKNIGTALAGGVTGIKGLAAALVNLASVNPMGIISLVAYLEQTSEGFRNFEDSLDDFVKKLEVLPGLLDLGSINDALMAMFDFDWSFSEDGFFAKAKECFSRVKEAFKLQDWAEVGSNIIEGIINGFAGAIGLIVESIGDFYTTLWDEVCKKFGIHSPAKEMEPLGVNIFRGILEGIRLTFAEFETLIAEWWDLYVAPWFTAEKWGEISQGIVDGISTKWGEVVEWWDSNIAAWWESNVAPWFTAEKWAVLGEGMKKGIYNGFWGVVSKITDITNSIIKTCENMVNYLIDKINDFVTSAVAVLNLLPETEISFTPINHVKFDPIKPPTLPALANGAVIRGGYPFAAILGDQPAGQMNIETPLNTMITAFNTALDSRGGSGGGPLILNVNMNGERFYQATLDDFVKEVNRRGGIDIEF